MSGRAVSDDADLIARAERIFHTTPPYWHCDGTSIRIPYTEWRSDTQRVFRQLAEWERVRECVDS